jgi:hypothetical protein
VFVRIPPREIDIVIDLTGAPEPSPQALAPLLRDPIPDDQ